MTIDNLTYEQKISLAEEFLAEAFVAASEKYGINHRDVSRLAIRIAFSAANAPKVKPASPKQPLPPEAPELWRTRDLNRRENAPGFIRRVYREWLGAGLERRHLATLDPDLYRALSVWVVRHPDDPIIAQLPPQHERIDEVIDQLSAEYPLDVLRKLGRVIDSRMRRKKNAQGIVMQR